LEIAFFVFDNFCITAHDHAAAAGRVRVEQIFFTVGNGAGRKVGTVDELHEVFDGGLRIVDEMLRRGETSPRLCGGMLVAMPTAMPSVPLSKIFGTAAGKHFRLFERAVVVGTPVDRFFVDVAQAVLPSGAHARFGVAHRGGRVAVDGAEVSLPNDERVAHHEILRHFDHGVIHSNIAVRVEFSEHVSHYPRSFARARTGGQAHAMHSVENAAVHGLQSVAHVREGARRNDRHGVVEIGVAHFLRDAAREKEVASGAVVVAYAPEAFE
jgi:hypothetical protein